MHEYDNNLKRAQSFMLMNVLIKLVFRTTAFTILLDGDRQFAKQ